MFLGNNTSKLKRWAVPHLVVANCSSTRAQSTSNNAYTLCHNLHFHFSFLSFLLRSYSLGSFSIHWTWIARKESPIALWAPLCPIGPRWVAWSGNLFAPCCICLCVSLVLLAPLFCYWPQWQALGACCQWAKWNGQLHQSTKRKQIGFDTQVRRVGLSRE